MWITLVEIVGEFIKTIVDGGHNGMSNKPWGHNP